MEPGELKRKYGSRLVFWGGGVDTQKTLPFGTPSLHDDSLSSEMDGGAPRFGWKLTLHGPSKLASCDLVFAGSVREVSLVALRKTTKTVPHGSRVSGTVVRPSEILKEVASVWPVSARHSSGSFPVMRNVASTCSVRSLRLSTK